MIRFGGHTDQLFVYIQPFLCITFFLGFDEERLSIGSIYLTLESVNLSLKLCGCSMMFH